MPDPRTVVDFILTHLTESSRGVAILSSPCAVKEKSEKKKKRRKRYSKQKETEDPIVLVCASDFVDLLL